MLPKHHVLLGLIFCSAIYLLFHLSLISLLIIFLSLVFIDVDHYIFYIRKYGNFSLKKAYLWHKSLPRNHKAIMHIFHTIEFHIFILLLSFSFFPFLFVLIGMLFHSLLDIIEMIYTNEVHTREFSLIRYLLRDKKNYLNYF